MSSSCLFWWVFSTSLPLPVHFQASRGAERDLKSGDRTGTQLLSYLKSATAELQTMYSCVRDYFSAKSSHAVVLLASCSQQEPLELVRACQSTPLAVVAKSGNWSAWHSRRSLMSRSGVFVNLDCPRGQRALADASQNFALRGTEFWLAWTSNGYDPRLMVSLGQLNFTFNSDFVLVHRESWGLLRLFGVHKVAGGRPTQWLEEGTWTVEGGLHLHGGRTANLQGESFRAAIVLHQLKFHGDKRHLPTILLSDNNTYMDSETRFGFALMTHLAETLNFTIDDIRVTDSWGYAQPNGSFDGMIGMLQRGEIDLGITPAVLTPPRLHVVDFTVQTWKLRTCFIFRHPRLLAPYKALLRPFLGPAGIGIAVVAAAAIAVLWSVRRWELAGSWRARGCFWEVVIAIVGILSQQGPGELETQSVAGRMALLSTLVLSVMLLGFYNSAIVYSLITPVPRTIHSVTDLIHSPLKVGLEDYSYNRAVFPKSKDPMTSTLYHSKILPDWPEGGFFSVADGIARVRSEEFAFYSEDSTLYRPIQDTYNDREKCSLSEIELNPAFITATTLLKNSPYKERMNRGLLLMLERGMRARQRAQWSARRPACTLSSDEVVSVGLQPIVPAPGLLLLGVLASVLLLLLERLQAASSAVQLRRTAVTASSFIGIVSHL